MSDEELRALERRFRSSGRVDHEAAWLRARVQVGELSLESLRLAAYRDEPAARHALAGEPDLNRWRRLTEFTRTWFADPLRAEDGSSEADLAETEARLGVSLPAAVREWFRLVGRRLRPCNQDHPVALHELALRDGQLGLVWENQGNWGCVVHVEEFAQPDPPVEVDFSDTGGGTWSAPASEFLLLYVLYETALNVATCSSAEQQEGPLGSLRPGVRGALLSNPVGYPRLPLPAYLGWADLFGDADTLHTHGFGMARNAAAWERLSAFTKG